MGKENRPLLTPNQITTVRLVATFLLFGAWYLTGDTIWRSLICLGFIVIFVGDVWDGIVARKYGLSTTFGIYFDPIVDQISYSALAILLIEAGFLPLWLLFIYWTALSLTIFIKQFAAVHNRVVPASILAKVKADLVSVPLVGLFLIHVVPGPFQMWIPLSVGLYLFLFKFLFQPAPEHTSAIRITLAILAVVFLARPEATPLPDYYGLVYLVLAIAAHWGSTLSYFWSHRDLFEQAGRTVSSVSSRQGQESRASVVVPEALSPSSALELNAPVHQTLGSLSAGISVRQATETPFTGGERTVDHPVHNSSPLRKV